MILFLHRIINQLSLVVPGMMLVRVTTLGRATVLDRLKSLTATATFGFIN